MIVHELARRLGTPLYVYEADEVRAAHRHLTTALPPCSRVYYSLKANPHPHLASVLADAGCHAEVSSVGEVEAALQAGFAPERIMMTGPGKTSDAVDLAIARGVRRFSAESPVDLARIGAAAIKAETVASCLLRINADAGVGGMGLAMTGMASQFGADASWVERHPEEFHADGAAVVGLHLYMGSNITDVDRLVDQFAASIDIARRLGALIDMSEVDLGGGFGAAYAHHGGRSTYPGLASRLGDMLDARLPGWRQGRPVISFESGRHLVGPCGTLVATVVDVKRSKGRTFIVLDTGVHHLGGMSGLRRLPRIVPDLIVVDPPGAPARPTVADCVLAGPLCTPLDTWSDGVPMPAVTPGDLVAVPNVGAYGLTASLVAFLGHPAPIEVVLGGGRVVSATRLSMQRVTVAQASDRRTDLEEITS